MGHVVFSAEYSHFRSLHGGAIPTSWEVPYMVGSSLHGGRTKNTCGLTYATRGAARMGATPLVSIAVIALMHV